MRTNVVLYAIIGKLAFHFDGVYPYFLSWRGKMYYSHNLWGSIEITIFYIILIKIRSELK